MHRIREVIIDYEGITLPSMLYYILSHSDQVEMYAKANIYYTINKCQAGFI